MIESNTIFNVAKRSWLLACLFFLFQFALRMAFAVACDPIKETFHLSAQQLGYLSSIRFYTYAIMQIPAGLMLDHWGLKKCILLGLSCVIAGTLLIASTDQLALAQLAQALIGFGSSFSFLSCLKAARLAFSLQMMAIAIGLTNAIGVIGSWVAGNPVANYMSLHTWQETWLLMAFLGAGLWIALNVWLLPQDSAKPYQLKETMSSASWMKMIKDRHLWHYGCLASLLLVSIVSFAELWAVPFFTDGCGIEFSEAANLPTWIFLGVAFGGPIGGVLSSFIKAEKILLLSSAFLIVLTTLLALQSPIVFFHLPSFLFLIGFCCSSLLLCFSLAQKRYSPSFAASISGCVNTLMVGLSASVQPLMGLLITNQYQVNTYLVQKGIIQNSYSLAMWILPLSALLATLLSASLVLEHQSRPAHLKKKTRQK